MALSETHFEELTKASGITPGIIEVRGYRTVDKPAELVKLGFAKDQAATAPGLLIPIYGIDGGVVLHQFKGSSPRERDGKPIKYETPAGAKMRLDCPPSVLKELMDPGVPLVITEGIKKVDSLVSRGACAVGLLGVWNFSGTNEHGAITELPEWAAIPFKTKDGTRRKVYIVFDSDIVDKQGVKLAAIRLANMLRRRGADVEMVRLPSEGDAKVGVDDWFVSGGTLDQMFAAVDPTLLRLDMIRVDGRGLSDLADDAIAALQRANDPPRVFVRGGDLVAVKTDERGITRLVSLDDDHVRSILSRATGWYKVGVKGKAAEVICPKEVATDVRKQLAFPGIPPISSVAKSPVVAGDKLERSPGYCPTARVYLDCPPPQEFAGSPEAAVAYLRDEVFREFPFQGDSDFAHALALSLLPIVRPAIEGPTPLHLFGAPSQGSGKTLLARVCLMLTQGDSIAMTTMSNNEEETRKRITASLMDGTPYLFFDNLVGRVSSAALSTILTNNVWVDRVLGASTNVQVEVRQALVATANNPELDRDIVRRSIRIWIDPGVERPEMRGGFRPVERIIRSSRPALVGALCRIVDGWLKEGSPAWSGTPLGSYEEWCQTIGGILEVARVPGFLGNVVEMRTADPQESAWAAFYTRWSLQPGARKVGELLPMFEADEDLSGMLGDGGDVSRRTKLATLLRNRLGVVCAGYIIELSPDRRDNSATYRLTSTDERQRMAAILAPAEPAPAQAPAKRGIAPEQLTIL